MENTKYAGFWIRFVALIIDLFLMAIVLYLPLRFIYGEEYWDGSRFIYGFWDVLLGYVIPVVGVIWFCLRFLGTPGKIVTNLKIVDSSTGRKMSVGQAIGRYFAYIPATLPLGLGLIWIGIDPKKQGWHDKIAGTVVIRGKTESIVEFEEKA